jgi:hypothetical protein
MAEAGVEAGMVVAGMVVLPSTAMATATATRPTVPCMATMGLTGAGIGVTKKRATPRLNAVRFTDRAAAPQPRLCLFRG